MKIGSHPNHGTNARSPYLVRQLSWYIPINVHLRVVHALEIRMMHMRKIYPRSGLRILLVPIDDVASYENYGLCVQGVDHQIV
jgi:hypothetical protein